MAGRGTWVLGCSSLSSWQEAGENQAGWLRLGLGSAPWLSKRTRMNVRQRRGGRARWAWDNGTDITLGMMLTPWGAYRCCSDASCKSENETWRVGLLCSDDMNISSVGSPSPSLNSTSAIHSIAAAEVTSLSVGFLICRMNMIWWYLLLSSLSL